MLICYSTFARNYTKQWVGWLILACSIGVGVVVGFIFVKNRKVGAFCLATWGGFSLGILMYNSFIYKLESAVALWSFALAIGLLYGVMILFFFDHVLIHATSFIGSFTCIFGIGIVAGKYPNPFTLAKMINNGQITSIDPIFYAYLGSNIVLYGIGCAYQYRVLKLKKDLASQINHNSFRDGTDTDTFTDTYGSKASF